MSQQRIKVKGSRGPFLQLTIFWSVYFLIFSTLQAPYLRLPMQSEDPYYYFFTHLISDGKFSHLTLAALDEGFKLGHSNPVGSIFYYLYFFSIHPLASIFGVEPWFISGVFRSILVLILLLLITKTASFFSGQSFKNNLVVFTFIHFALIQLHTPWSHDFIASGPAQGMLTPILFLSLILIVLNTLVGQKGYESLFSLRFFLPFSLMALFTYEVHVISIILCCLLTLAHGKSMKLKFKDSLVHKQILTTSSFALTIFLVARVLLTENDDQYSGTQITDLATASKTIWYATLSTLPFSSWKIVNDVLPYAFDSIANPLYLISFILFLFFFVFTSSKVKFVFTSSRVKEVSHAADMKRIIISTFFLFWIGNVTLQGITQKTSNDVNMVGKVYFFSAAGHLFIVLCFFVLYTETKTLNRKLRIKRVSVIRGVFTFIMALNVFCQLNINLHIVQKQIIDYQNFEKLLQASVATPTSSADRCSLLIKWSPEYVDNYYSRAITQGLDFFSKKNIGTSFCDSYWKGLVG